MCVPRLEWGRVGGQRGAGWRGGRSGLVVRGGRFAVAQDLGAPVAAGFLTSARRGC